MSSNYLKIYVVNRPNSVRSFVRNQLFFRGISDATTKDSFLTNKNLAFCLSVRFNSFNVNPSSFTSHVFSCFYMFIGAGYLLLKGSRWSQCILFRTNQAYWIDKKYHFVSKPKNFLEIVKKKKKCLRIRNSWQHFSYLKSPTTHSQTNHSTIFHCRRYIDLLLQAYRNFNASKGLNPSFQVATFSFATLSLSTWSVNIAKKQKKTWATHRTPVLS